jgi:histidine triad (HIT) family protein
MTAQSECLFCRIVRKDLNAAIVFENDTVLAFKDISPQAPVHILIIPKKHIASLTEALPSDQALLGELQQVARHLAQELGIAAAGYRLVLNCGANAGQAVAHMHYHLLGGRVFSWPPG